MFQLSTRNYYKEITLVRQELALLETEYKVDTLLKSFLASLVDILQHQSDKLINVIEKSGMMKDTLGHTIGEQITNFAGHYLERKGRNVWIKKINYE